MEINYNNKEVAGFLLNWTNRYLKLLILKREFIRDILKHISNKDAEMEDVSIKNLEKLELELQATLLDREIFFESIKVNALKSDNPTTPTDVN